MKKALIISAIVAALWCGALEIAERHGIREGRAQQRAIDDLQQALHVCTCPDVQIDGVRIDWTRAGPDWIHDTNNLNVFDDFREPHP